MLEPPKVTSLGGGLIVGDEPAPLRGSCRAMYINGRVAHCNLAPARIRSTTAKELSSRGEHRVVMGGSPAIVPKIALSLDNSGCMGRPHRSPKATEMRAPEGVLRIMKIDRIKQPSGVNKEQLGRNQKSNVPSGAFHERRDDLVSHV